MYKSRVNESMVHTVTRLCCRSESAYNLSIGFICSFFFQLFLVPCQAESFVLSQSVYASSHIYVCCALKVDRRIISNSDCLLSRVVVVCSIKQRDSHITTLLCRRLQSTRWMCFSAVVRSHSTLVESLLISNAKKLLRDICFNSRGSSEERHNS